MAQAKTVEEIATSLLKPAPTSPDVGEQEEIVNDTSEEEVDEEGTDDEEVTEEGDQDESTEGEEVETDDEEDKGEQEDDDADVLTISDDDLIEVKIDGKTEFRSIADAKKALSGEGAIEKRLQEATEARKTAQAERTQFLEQFALAQNQLVGVINQVQDALFVPFVEKPKLALRSTNPQEYVRQLEAYERDQERVDKGKSKVFELLGTQKKAFDEQVEAYRVQQGQLLAKALPQLGDKDKGTALLKDMQDTAVNIYGYTAEEVAIASDHRMYRLVHDAMMYHKLRKGTGVMKDVKDVSDQKAKTPRKMRAGNNMRKAVATAKATERQQAVKTARKTGKIDDIAKTLLRG